MDRNRNTITLTEHIDDSLPVIVVSKPTVVQAQLDEWYHMIMCYNDIKPQEGTLHLLKHFQSPEENHLKQYL